MSDPTDVTGELVRYGQALSYGSLPQDAVIVAKTCALDWLGCALAGSDEPVVRVLLAEAHEETEAAAATVIGRDDRTSPSWAAWINGAASHALDYDDTLFVLPEHPIHPTAPVMPAALALAEQRRTSGADLLAAFVAGVETAGRIGAVVGVEHYASGWHSTATLGSFGAAAACAHMLALPEDAWRHALGIAGTQSAGLKSVFGSMSKPLQTGRAAFNGLLAAKWAKRGLTSHRAIVETAQGFASTHHGNLRPSALHEFGGRFLINDTVFKHHASCYFTHSAIEAVARIVEEHSVTADRVRDVRVDVPAQHLNVCNIVEPMTGLEGKFSLRATVAMALLGDETDDPAAFSDERMHAREVVEMQERVAVHAAPNLWGTQTRVEVRLDDGAVRQKIFDVGVPATDLEQQWSSIASKFGRLAAPVVGEIVAGEIQDLVRDLEHVDVPDLLTLCRANRDASVFSVGLGERVPREGFDADLEPRPERE